MPRLIAIAEVVAILQSGDFTRLFGGLEDDHLECKSAPYNLDQEREKMELAKDVSALANAEGGIILVGVQTEREPAHQGDIIRRVGCFAQDFVDFGQYRNVISGWCCHRFRDFGLNVIQAQQAGTRELRQSSCRKRPAASGPMSFQELLRIQGESSAPTLAFSSAYVKTSLQ